MTRPAAAVAALSLTLFMPGPVRAADDAMPVEVAPVEKVALETRVELTGSLAAPNRALLSSQVEGLVETLGADAGDQVTAGAVLVRLDDDLASIDVERSKAAVAEATARLEEATRRVREAEDLIADKHISPTEFAAREAEARITEAALASARAAHARNLEILDLHTITAPFDAAVISRRVGVGEWVERSTGLFEVAGVEQLRLEVQVPQRLAVALAEGTRVAVTFDALPGERYELSVSRVVRAASTDSRTFPVFVNVDNRRGVLAPGMSARIAFRIGGERSGSALAVPRDALIQKADGSTSVWVLDRPGAGRPTVRAVAVRTRRAMGPLVAVDSDDLVAGAEVVVRGNELLRAGQTVTVVADEAADG